MVVPLTIVVLPPIFFFFVSFACSSGSGSWHISGTVSDGARLRFAPDPVLWLGWPSNVGCVSTTICFGRHTRFPLLFNTSTGSTSTTRFLFFLETCFLGLPGMIWAEKKESDKIHVVQMRRFSSRSPHPDLALYGRPELVPHPGCIPMWKCTSLLRECDLSSPINVFFRFYMCTLFCHGK